MASNNEIWGDPLAGIRDVTASNFANYAWLWRGSMFFDMLPGVGKPLGGELYRHNKRFSQFTVDALPASLLPYFGKLLRSPQIQEATRNNDMATRFELIGKEVEKFKESCRKAGLTEMKDAELDSPEYNHQFLVEDVHGNIKAVSETQLVNLFGKHGDESGQMPNLVFTCSHARGETLSDVTDITHGMERVIAEATEHKTKFAKVDFSKPDLGVAPDETLIVYRCDVLANPWLNGAQLLRRTNEIKHNLQTGQGDADRFQHVSPAAIAINKLTLAMMAEDPQQVLATGDKLISDAFGEKNERIELRDDASRIANHLVMMGYSKGGNVVSDAGCRLLPHELQAKNKNGTDIFYSRQEGEMLPITMHGIHEVKRLIRPISVWAIAAVEHALTKAQLNAGATRVAFNGTNDFISVHSNYRSQPGDERIIGKSVTDDLGHNPKHTLGTRDLSDSCMMMEDARIKRRMIEVCAPKIGKATIEQWLRDPENNRRIYLNLAPGTTDRLMLKTSQHMLSAFNDNGLAVESLHSTYPNSNEFCLTFRKPLTAAANDNIRQAFQHLRDEPASGLVIGEAILGQEKQRAA